MFRAFEDISMPPSTHKSLPLADTLSRMTCKLSLVFNFLDDSWNKENIFVSFTSTLYLTIFSIRSMLAQMSDAQMSASNLNQMSEFHSNSLLSRCNLEGTHFHLSSQVVTALSEMFL